MTVPRYAPDPLRMISRQLICQTIYLGYQRCRLSASIRHVLQELPAALGPAKALYRLSLLIDTKVDVLVHL